MTNQFKIEWNAAQAAEIALATAIIVREFPDVGDVIGIIAGSSYLTLANAVTDRPAPILTAGVLTTVMRDQMVGVERRKEETKKWMDRLAAMQAARPPITVVDESTSIDAIHAAARKRAIEMSADQAAILVTMSAPVAETTMDSACWSMLNSAFLCQGEEFFLTSAIVLTSLQPMDIISEVQGAINYCIEFGHDYGIAIEIFRGGQPIAYEPAPFVPRIFE